MRRLENDVSDLVLTSNLWLPEDIRQALNTSQIDVEYFHNKTANEVLDSCIRSEHVGITLIRSTTNVVVCLTTVDKLYAIDMNNSKHARFLKELLEESNLKFYAVRSSFVTPRLKKFDIDASNSIIDLNALDIFIQFRRCSVNDTTSYGPDILTKKVDTLKYRDQFDLAAYWLGVNLSKTEPEQELEETKILMNERDTTAALNVIRKRSCLIRAIALKMNDALEKITYHDVDMIYSFAHLMTDEDYNEYENRQDDSYSTLLSFLSRSDQVS